MVNYFIYAKDFSGSTEGNSYYHSNGMKSFKQFKIDVENIVTKELSIAKEPQEAKIIYLHWGDKCYEVDEETTILSYNMMESGNMNTHPRTIIEWMQGNYDICGENNKIKLLYIVTDGMIAYGNTERCFELNQKMHYEHFVFHAFNKDLSEIDLSVAASFIKSHCKIYRNFELLDNVNVFEEFGYDKINVDNFEVQKDSLGSYIRLKFIHKYKHNTLALQEIDKLKKLRNRLFVKLSSNSQKNSVNLNTKDKNLFLQEFATLDWYRNLNGLGHDAKVRIEKSISTLINYIVSDTKSFSFDELRFNRKFIDSVKEENIKDDSVIDVDFTSEQEIEFPDVILDDEKGIPVIILTEFNLLDKIIFHKTNESADVSPASFSKFKSAMDCPLFLLNDADISESIGYFYTLNVYKQLLESTTKTDPRTRRPFHGGLVLTDTDHFDKYNDYILAATYFDFKKINYNIGLFYYILWKNCENKEWMDKNVIERFKKYVMRRISATVCKIGLSSLPLDPQEKTSLLTALWYCVELSSTIFKHNPKNFIHERLRMYYGVAHCMIEILKYFDYDLDLRSIEKRRDVIRHVMILKKIPTYREKVYYLLEKIFKKANGFLVNQIEKPLNLNKLNNLKLNHRGMLCDDAIEEKVHLNDYVHLMHFIDDSGKSKDGKPMFELCEETFRPYFTIGQNRSFYTELVKATRKVIINNDYDKDKIEITYGAVDSLEFDKTLSLYNLYINCVIDSEKYPTWSEYIEYISKKKKFNGDLVTIFPTNAFSIAEGVYKHYQNDNIVTKVDVNQFIKVCKAYVNRSERIKAEGIMKFNNEDEIKEFIFREGLKVNLRKKDLFTQVKEN